VSGTFWDRLRCAAGYHDLCWIGICHREGCRRAHLPGVDLNGHPKPVGDPDGK
jgi:hypothetical protein